jgi:hypothetical protein
MQFEWDGLSHPLCATTYFTAGLLEAVTQKQRFQTMTTNEAIRTQVVTGWSTIRTDMTKPSLLALIHQPHTAQPAIQCCWTAFQLLTNVGFGALFLNPALNICPT